MTLKKEITYILIVLLPFIYLGYIWEQLPETVPVHWDINGEANRFGQKYELLLIPFLLPLLTYILFLLAPIIDPKGKLSSMGNKFKHLKFLLITFMSVLAVYILYTAKHATLTNPNNILLLIGLLYVVLGNYFKTIKANYFIGIRTPWTLESETTWKKTHVLGGKLWLIGGLLVILFSLILDKQLNTYLFLIITGIITIIPIGYSYFISKK